MCYNFRHTYKQSPMLYVSFLIYVFKFDIQNTYIRVFTQYIKYSEPTAGDKYNMSDRQQIRVIAISFSLFMFIKT